MRRGVQSQRTIKGEVNEKSRDWIKGVRHSWVTDMEMLYTQAQMEMNWLWPMSLLFNKPAISTAMPEDQWHWHTVIFFPANGHCCRWQLCFSESAVWVCIFTSSIFHSSIISMVMCSCTLSVYLHVHPPTCRWVLYFRLQLFTSQALSPI